MARTRALGRSVLELATDPAAFFGDLDRAEGRVGRFARTVSDAGGRMKTVGKSIQGVGRDVLPLSAGLLAGGAAAVTMSTQLNASMANVASLIPGNVERVRELKTAVQDMAVATGQSTADLSAGLYDVVSAFGDTADTTKILDINARAAAAGLATTQDAIGLTSAVTKAYGDTSADAVQRTADLAFQAVKLGQTTLPELASSIGRVTPLTAELGVKQSELFGVMATGTGVTGTAADVSTQLRGILQALLVPTASMTSLYEAMGVESGKALIQQHGLQGALEAVTFAASASGMPLQSFIGSIEGQTLALALAGPQADTFTSKLGQMSDSSGAMVQAFTEQTEGINAAGFQWNQFIQKLTVAAQRIGDQLVPHILQLADALKAHVLPAVRPVLEWIAKLSPETKAWGVAIAAVIAVAAPAAIAIGSMVTAIGAVVAVVGGPAVLAIGGLAAAVAGVVTVWRNWDEISVIIERMVSGALDWLVGRFGAGLEKVKGFLDTTLGWFRDMGRTLVGNSIVQDEIVNPTITEFGRLSDDVGGRLAPELRAAVVSQFRGMADGVSAESKRAAKEAREAARATAEMFRELEAKFARQNALYAESGALIRGEYVRSLLASGVEAQNVAGQMVPLAENTIAVSEATMAADRAAFDAATSFGSTFGSSLRSAGADLLELKDKFFDFSNVTKSIFEGAFGPSGFLTQLMSGGMSALAGLAVKGLSKIGGAIAGGFKRLFGGPSAAEEAGRVAWRTYSNSLAASASEDQIAQALGAKWANDADAAAWVVIRDAVELAGGAAAEAEALWTRYVDAIKKGPDAVAAVTAEIDAWIARADDAAAAVDTTTKAQEGLATSAVDATRAAATASEVAAAAQEQLGQKIDAAEAKAANLEQQMAGGNILAAQQMRDALTSDMNQIETVLERLTKPRRIGISFDVGKLKLPDMPPVKPMALGGEGRVTAPTMFLAGEAGPEDYAFSGAHRRFGGGGSSNATDGLLRQMISKLDGQPTKFARAIADQMALSQR